MLLGQSRSAEAQTLLAKTAQHELFISDFSLHSIGVLLVRHASPSVFAQFVTDIILKSGVRVASLRAEDMSLVVDAVKKFQLGFDDAYQHALAEKYALTIVSFDSDFDKTALGRRVPNQIP